MNKKTISDLTILPENKVNLTRHFFIEIWMYVLKAGVLFDCTQSRFTIYTTFIYFFYIVVFILVFLAKKSKWSNSVNLKRLTLDECLHHPQT